MLETPATVGERISFIRKFRRMSQPELGQRSGLDSVTIFRFEKGLVHPSSMTIGELARVLQVKADWLATGNPASAPRLLRVVLPEDKAPPPISAIVQQVAQRLDATDPVTAAEEQMLRGWVAEGETRVDVLEELLWAIRRACAGWRGPAPTKTNR